MPIKNNNKNIQLNDELQFLVNCCKVNPSKEDIDFIFSYLNAEDFELKTLIDLAHQHGILPLVYKSLKSFNTTGIMINTEILNELKAHYLTIVQRNMLMSAELIRIMKLLEDNGIEALAFKGPTLSQLAYGDITLRQYSDLDIYVHREDIIKISKILSNDCYDSRVELKYFKNNAFLNVNSDVQFYHKSGSVLMEIHWTVFRSAFSNTMKRIDLWNSPKKVYIQNYELSTFQTETLLLYLCMHGSKHIWERIEWIVDVDKLIRTSTNINWEKIYKLAYTVNGKIMLELGLYLSSQLFNTPIPNKVRKNLDKNKMILKLSDDVLKTLDEKEYFSDTELQKNYQYFRFHLSLRDTLNDKISYIFKALFPLKSSDVEIINLPKRLYFIYYFLRPFRLISKYFQKLF